MNKPMASILAAAVLLGGGIALAAIGTDRLGLGSSETTSAAVPTTLAAADPAPEKLTVVELFTSQACRTCPAAEAFLADLSGRHPDILALEFHVTYWDNLVDGDRGRWKDLFSDPTYTERQREYNRRLRGFEGVYTPQMVIDGMVQANGIAREEVLSAISMGSQRDVANIRVDIEWNTADGMSVRIDGDFNSDNAAPKDLGVWLVKYDAAARTLVKSGENMGRVLDNHNIVRDLVHIGQWSGGAISMPVGSVLLAPNQRCAVLIQTPDQGAIAAAVRCPAAPT